MSRPTRGTEPGGRVHASTRSRGVDVPGTDPADAFAAPRPPRTFVPRPRLERALDEAATRPVTVLIAPAGSGKTASLAGWSANRDDDALWLAVRSTEQGARLPEALLAAAGAEAATSAVSPLPPDAVVDALHQSAQDPVVLVVDDAHHLSASSWDLLDTVLTLAPDRVRLVLSSRRDAPLPLVALELAHDIAVLRADAFRFDDDEAATLVAAHNRDVPDDDLRALLQRAGGWAAALVLGARRLGGGAAGDRGAPRQDLCRTDHPPPGH